MAQHQPSVREEKKEELSKPPISTSSAPAAVDLGGLNTVEQIMQRWSSTDPSKISFDWIGNKQIQSQEDDEKLRQGILPSYMESPQTKEVSKVKLSLFQSNNI